MHFANAKGILSAQNGMNVYRGCTHGCIYCDSRSRCYHIDHDFEDIEVKENAPQLLEDALRRKRRKCMMDLPDLPERPNRATRIRLKLFCSSADVCHVTAEDLGFGGFFPATHKVWEDTIPLETFDDE